MGPLYRVASLVLLSAASGKLMNASRLYIVANIPTRTFGTSDALTEMSIWAFADESKWLIHPTKDAVIMYHLGKSAKLPSTGRI